MSFAVILERKKAVSTWWNYITGLVFQNDENFNKVVAFINCEISLRSTIFVGWSVRWWSIVSIFQIPCLSRLMLGCSSIRITYHRYHKNCFLFLLITFEILTSYYQAVFVCLCDGAISFLGPSVFPSRHWIVCIVTLCLQIYCGSNRFQ